MSEQIQRGNEPFTTTNKQLALALITAGCKFASFESGGPAINHWTPATARERRIITGKVFPEVFEQAVMRATDAKISGQVTYCIVRDSIWESAIKEWDKWVDEFEMAEKQKRSPMLPGLTAEQVIQACYFRLHNERDMEPVAFVRSPNLSLGSTKKDVTPIEGAPSELSSQRSYTESGENLKVWSLNLNDEDRARIGIHPKPTL